MNYTIMPVWSHTDLKLDKASICGSVCVAALDACPYVLGLRISKTIGSIVHRITIPDYYLWWFPPPTNFPPPLVCRQGILDLVILVRACL